ncbi:MAG: dienelactone hydrolase family protein [Gemmatimonadaceae bacterium]|nr:dienelactone hydrolase family protein [Gemmatimonadaceae bacterium]
MLGSLAAAPWLAGTAGRYASGRGGDVLVPDSGAQDTPPLAPGTPMSPERMALIEAFKQHAADVDAGFEARTHTGAWAMPYRLFQPAASGRHPLVIYLHGSGGLGTDNQKQMATGNIFGTRVWALPEHQRQFPCFVLAPQTDRGWANYGEPAPGDSVARVVDGVGDGVATALLIIDQLLSELPIDARRVYVTGQSMGGLGVWNMLAHRPAFFAAAVPCCGSAGPERVSTLANVPIWNFHGDADKTVPVAVSRERMAALRAAGGRPLHTEYAGVGHNAWEWAYTEPALLPWMFARVRR